MTIWSVLREIRLKLRNYGMVLIEPMVKYVGLMANNAINTRASARWAATLPSCGGRARAALQKEQTMLKGRKQELGFEVRAEAAPRDCPRRSARHNFRTRGASRAGRCRACTAGWHPRRSAMLPTGSLAWALRVGTAQSPVLRRDNPGEIVSRLMRVRQHPNCDCVRRRCGTLTAQRYAWPRVVERSSLMPAI